MNGSNQFNIQNGVPQRAAPTQSDKRGVQVKCADGDRVLITEPKSNDMVITNGALQEVGRIDGLAENQGKKLIFNSKFRRNFTTIVILLMTITCFGDLDKMTYLSWKSLQVIKEKQ